MRGKILLILSILLVPTNPFVLSLSKDRFRSKRHLLRWHLTLNVRRANRWLTHHCTT